MARNTRGWTGLPTQMLCAAASPSWPARPAAPGAALPRRWARLVRRLSVPAAAASAATRGPTTTGPETIEESAELVTQLGGTGVAIQVDHLDLEQVGALAERLRDRLRRASTSWSMTSGAPRPSRVRPPTWNTPIWEHDLDDGLRILRLGVDTHLITSHCLLPLLVARPGGLLG